MDDITKIQSIIEKIGLSRNILVHSSLIEKHQKELYTILLAMSKTPLEYDKIFTEHSKSLISREIQANKEKIYVPMTLEEHKENIQQVLNIIQVIVPKLENQLESMKNKGYFVPWENITKHETVWVRRPSRGLIWDRGISRKEPKKVLFTKKEFTLEDIELFLQKLQNIKQESALFIKSIKSIELLDNPFAKDNIKIAQEKWSEKRKEVMAIYTAINSQFGIGDIPEYLLDKELDVDENEYEEMHKIIREKSVDVIESQEIINMQDPINRKEKIGFFSRITTRDKHIIKKWNNLICTIPEIDTLFSVLLTDMKDITNPEYLKNKDQLRQLEVTVDQISTILCSLKK